MCDLECVLIPLSQCVMNESLQLLSASVQSQLYEVYGLLQRAKNRQWRTTVPSAFDSLDFIQKNVMQYLICLYSGARGARRRGQRHLCVIRLPRTFKSTANDVHAIITEGNTNSIVITGHFIRLSCMLLLKCYFTSTETVGLLGTEAQDVRLDFHTAPEL